MPKMAGDHRRDQTLAWSDFAAATPATRPLAHAHWKLNPPTRPSTSQISPARWSPGTIVADRPRCSKMKKTLAAVAASEELVLVVLEDVWWKCLVSFLVGPL